MDIRIHRRSFLRTALTISPSKRMAEMRRSGKGPNSRSDGGLPCASVASSSPACGALSGTCVRLAAGTSLPSGHAPRGPCTSPWSLSSRGRRGTGLPLPTSYRAASPFFMRLKPPNSSCKDRRSPRPARRCASFPPIPLPERRSARAGRPVPSTPEGRLPELFP